MLHSVHIVHKVVNTGNRTPAAHFVERFALLLDEAGMPRMPARAFAAILAEDSGRLTARELADRLGVSPAAVSGAVRYLTQAGMISRGREPGARRDDYRIHDDVWYETYAHRGEMLRRWEEAMDEGAEALGRDTPAGRRLEETREFFAFLRGELPALMERWRARAQPTRRAP
jgi:DNA-binding transcriptional regulator GbsR (MarR family)